MYIEKLRKCFKHGPENLKSRGLEGVWELLGAILKRKTIQKLSWLILVNFGRARIDQNLAQRGQDGGKLEPRWHQDPPSWSQDGHLEAIWGAILSIFGCLGGDLWENGRSVKTNNTPTFRLHFGVLGSLVGGSWEVFWAILATSWVLLGDLGVKLETSWQHVRTKMAEDG